MELDQPGRMDDTKGSSTERDEPEEKQKRRLDEAPLDGLRHRLGAVADPHLFENTTDGPLDRGLAVVKLAAHLSGGDAAGEESQDGLFPL